MMHCQRNIKLCWRL